MMNPQEFVEEPEHRADPAEIKRAVDLLFAPDVVVELRVLKAKDGQKFCNTVSGNFSGEHRKELAEAATYWSSRGNSVYTTLNPVLPDLLARSTNRCKVHAGATTKDEEILRRAWLLIDFDPKRPSGISATDEEKEAALRRARDCRAWLTSQG
jgi:hypothetical protein